jgi:hypothetical protein
MRAHDSPQACPQEDEGGAGMSEETLDPQPRKAKKASSATSGDHPWLTFVRLAAAVSLGLLLPLLLMFQAYQAESQTVDSMRKQTTLAEIVGGVPESMRRLDSPADYQLLMSIFLESSNQKVVLQKQLMKSGVIEIGFAVMSLGMCCILLGFDAGGLDGEFAAEKIKAKFKIVSSGIAIFVLGAALAGAAGLLPNPYETIGNPPFILATDSVRAQVSDRAASAAWNFKEMPEGMIAWEFIERCIADGKDDSHKVLCVSAQKAKVVKHK